MSELYVKFQTKKAMEQGTANNAYKLEGEIKENVLEKVGKKSYEESEGYLVVNGNCLIIKNKE